VSKLRNRKGETLFIDARKMGEIIDRVHRDLSPEEISKISSTYHAWRGDKGEGTYLDIPGFCRSVSKDEIASHGFVLTPGRYVGAEDIEEDDELFDEKMNRLTKDIQGQFAESRKLEQLIQNNLKGLGYGK